MEGTNCNGEGGWTRVAFVNMSEPNATCPTGLTQIQQSGLTLCSRDADVTSQGSLFTTLGLNYSAVCGRVQGYQSGTPTAFSNSNINRSISLDGIYVDGVSITHGTNPQNHVWTYVVGRGDASTSGLACPCNNGSTASIPSFVGDDYYCESGISKARAGIFYFKDPLWDGMQCNNLESTCCTTPSMPWFSTAVSETTNDDLYLRLLFNGNLEDQGSPLDLIELYIR